MTFELLKLPIAESKTGIVKTSAPIVNAVLFLSASESVSRRKHDIRANGRHSDEKPINVETALQLLRQIENPTKVPINSQSSLTDKNRLAKFILNNFEKCIWILGVEGLVGPHDRHEVLGVGQVGDGVRVAGNHLHGSHVGTGDGVLVDGERVSVGVLPHFP